MPIPTMITDLSTTAASNFPQGTDSPASLDDVQRAHASFIAKLRDESASLTGTQTLTNKTLTSPVINAINNTPIGATTPAAGSFTTLSATGALTTAAIKEDAAGNVGLGVTPSAWFTGVGLKAVQVGSFAVVDQTNGYSFVTRNAYINSSNINTYISNGYATSYQQGDGSHVWNVAPSGTAGAAITWNQAMTLDASGNLLVGVASGTYHNITKNIAQGNPMLGIDNAANLTAIFYAVAGAAYNASNTAIKVGTNNVTGRSINAGGTVNASGADYAEYERNNGLTIAKGSIVGFKLDGTLTNIFADAIRFAIKSTNPSYVGGDTWGSEEQVGKRPEEPIRIADKTEQRELTPASAQYQSKEDFELSGALPDIPATYETIILEAGDTDAQWATKQADYTAAKTAYEAALEAARQLVDRIAYSGKVPCNVMGATPGGYIIASATGDGSIAGIFVADPDFTQYKKAVGRVNKIIDEAAAKRLAKQINVADWQQFVGRCEVAVIIH